MNGKLDMGVGFKRLALVYIAAGILVGAYLYLSSKDEGGSLSSTFICFVEVDIAWMGDFEVEGAAVADFNDATVSLMQSNRRKIFALAPFGDNFLFHLPGPCARAHEELPSLLDDIRARMLPAQRAVLPTLTILADEPTKSEIACGAKATPATCPDADKGVNSWVQQLRAYQEGLDKGIGRQPALP